MSRQFFITLPVADVEAAAAFFTSLGFEFDPQFAAPDAACMTINESTSVMLATRSRVAELTDGVPVIDPRTGFGALYAFSADSREHVDALVAAAVAAGGTAHGEATDHGFMYDHGFRDLDGHGWGVLWMDPKAAAEGPPELAETA
jgi:predicted lactoylglutathione lyase